MIEYETTVEREIEVSVTLASVTEYPVTLEVTSSPHRDGDPDHRFYEVWVRHRGGSVRSTHGFHAPSVRAAILEYVSLVTGMGNTHDETLNEILDTYCWE